MGPGFRPVAVDETVASRTAREAEEDRLLTAARESFPGWVIHETFGGFIAYPADAPVMQSMTLDGLVSKVRQAEAS